MQENGPSSRSVSLAEERLNISQLFPRSHDLVFWSGSAIRSIEEHPFDHPTTSCRAQKRCEGFLLQVQRPNISQARKT